jgi:hypothetical protein
MVMQKARTRSWLLAVTAMGAAVATEACTSGSSPFVGDVATPIDGSPPPGPCGGGPCGSIAVPIDAGLVANPMDGGDGGSDASDGDTDGGGDGGDGG